MIHRDIKPKNILLQNWRPLDADFVFALAVQQAGGSRITETGLASRDECRGVARLGARCVIEKVTP